MARGERRPVAQQWAEDGFVVLRCALRLCACIRSAHLYFGRAQIVSNEQPIALNCKRKEDKKK
eukprot:SAG31_NODE_29367_length_396_cov_1.023569_1_plen_62_part_10